jgi:hypothetical protein
MRSHTARFSASPSSPHAAISSIVRWHPVHSAVRAFISHTEMHGDGTGEDEKTDSFNIFFKYFIGFAQ